MSEEHKNRNIVQEDLIKLDDFLDKYETKVGLSGLTESDVSKYLSMNQDDLRKLTAEECSEGAYLLMKEALYIQHEINKHKAQMEWAKARIDKTIASELQNYGTRFSTFETRQILAIKNNSYANDLQKIVNRCQLIITRLSYLPSHIKNIADVLSYYKNNKNLSDKHENTRIH